MAVSIPVVLLLCLFVYRAPRLSGSGITDPDYYWHIDYGEWILAHGTLPTVDFWSWTNDGHPYRLTQWLGEVAMGLAQQVAGERGTAFLAALLVTLTIAASYRAARCYLDNRLAAIAVAAGCNLLLLSLACRPHQFTHLGLALLTWIVAAYQTGQRRALYWLPPLFALWVNLHGAYAFGLTYLVMAAGARATDACVRRTPSEIRTTALPLLVAAAASLVATLLNPYGWGAWQYAIEIASMKASAAGVVDEWAATSIKTEVGLHFFLVTAALASAMATSRQRPSLALVLLALGLGAIGWSAVRLSLMSTLLMVPILAASLRHTAFYDLVFAGEARRYDTALPPWAAVAAVATVLASAVHLGRIDTRTERYLAQQMPVAEGSFLREKAITGRILNPPEIGGYLIRKLGAKVSIDTRYDLYGDHSLFAFLFAQRGEPGWREYVEGLDPDVLLLSTRAPLTHLLAESGSYRPVFEGPAYAVLVRPRDYPELATIPLSRPSQAVLQRLQ